MASPSGLGYDVFLSFRGEDTRKNFTDHLHTALLNAQFRTFRDDPELKRGENIKEELEKAIQQSRSSVIVFSKDYTSSRWCLDELVIILQRKRISDHVVLPVFYDVNPSQLRKQANDVNPSQLRKQAKTLPENQSLEKLNEWRAALREVTNLAGMVLDNEADGHESKLIQKIVTVIQDKLGVVPLTHVQEELQKKLLFINPYLDDAEGKQLKFPTTVKPWLHKLKEAVYEAEDLLQEIKTEALRQKIEHEYGSSTNKVQELNSCLHASQSALIYPKVKEVLNRLDSIMERRRDVLGMEASAGCRVSQTIPSTSLVEDSGVYGRDDVKETLVKLLLSDDESGNKIRVIPILGMGGIGKTTLAQILYNDVRVKNYFDLKAWVCVSKEFDVLRISQHIYESLTSVACQMASLDRVQVLLKETLVGKKFFFVLDDIWNRNYNQLELLRRPFESGAHGSKIIVTTRDENVTRMMGSVDAPHLMPLSEEDGWSLFKNHALKNAGVGAHSHLEEIGRQIVRKCNGLPLAIKSLGGLLCSKLAVGEWETILKSDMWELPQDEIDILPSLWLSYMYLPPQLKRCFAYCSIFPKNHLFGTSELVYLWKAEDLLQPKNNRIAEEIGQDYFNDLISRSFFQPSSSSDEHFIMHDLLNDLASFVSGEFCFRWEGSESPNNLSKTRHFSFISRYPDEADSLEVFEALQQAKCLHTFLPLQLQLYRSSGKGLNEFLPKLQCLRMLTLSWYNVEELPDSINNLKHLRYLDLSFTHIKKLPDTICSLYNLQALLLICCLRLTELPANLGRLINLSHLDIKATTLKKMPPYMGKLKDLQMLPEFVLDRHTAVDNLPELKKLEKLRGRLGISGLVHSSGLEAYILRDKKFLKELVLDWGLSYRRGWDLSEEGNNTVEEREVLEKLEPHLNLERLTIRYYGGKMFPGWSGYYSSSALVYLELVNCENCISLPPLGQLPSLRELHIDGLHGVVSIGSEFYYGDGNTINKPFRSLQVLRFGDMSEWQEWCHVLGDEDEGGSFPNLLKLHLLDCPNLSGRLALDGFPMLNEVILRATELSLVTRSAGSKLLSLNKLELHWCPNIVTIPDAPNLTEIQIRGCENLSSLPEQMDTLLPSLVSLSVEDCRELECFPEGGFPSKLKSLVIMGCKKLNARSLQNLIKGLGRLATLEELRLDFDCDEEVDWFAEEEGRFPSSLTFLKIYSLNCETIDGTKWFGHLNSLRNLWIEKCPALRCLPETGLPTSLQTLDIRNCHALRRLPKSRLPTSLQRLFIWDCPALRRLPKRWLPTSLQSLFIWDCPALRRLPKSRLPTSLQKLWIQKCPALWRLPETGLLTSLQELYIWDCPAIRCLPKSGLPTSLSHLNINGCPLLEKRCQTWTGEDWPKIFHIRDLSINLKQSIFGFHSSYKGETDHFLRILQSEQNFLRVSTLGLAAEPCVKTEIGQG